MFGKLGSLFVTVDAQTRGFDTGVDRSQRRFNAFATAMTARTASLAAGMSQRFSSLFGGIAASFGINPLVGGLFALGAAGGAAVKGASDLNETLSKTDAVLGSGSEAVKKFADEMASRFGLVKKETLDTATSFAGLGKGLGNLAGADLAKFSTDFTKLAADLSSFANIDMAEAGQSLTIALSGEQSDTLKRMGVIVNETTLKQYALANGIKGVNGELSEQQKLSIRAALIMQGLSDASGDLEKTQGGFANQSRKLWGTIQNALARVGAILQPLSDGFVGFVNRIATAFDGFVSSYGPALTSFSEGVAAAFGWIMETLGEMIASIIWSGQQIAAEIATWTLYQQAVSAVGAAWEWLAATGAAAFNTLGVIYRNFGSVAATVFLRAKQWAMNLVEAIAWMVENSGTYLEWFGRNFVNLIVDAFNASLTVVKNFVTNVWDNLSALWDWIAGGMTGDLALTWTPLLDGFQATMEKLPDIAGPVFTDLQSEIDGLWDQINEAETARVNAAKPMAKKADEAVKKAVAGDRTGQAAKKVEAKFVGIEAFGKDIQTAILGKGNEAKRTADGVQQLVVEQRRTNQAITRADRTARAS